MATTATERKLFVAGEWVETGEWIEVRSPFSGDVVGRVAKGGVDETRRALDAAERALENPLPAHKRAEILVRVAGYLGRRHEEVARVYTRATRDERRRIALCLALGLGYFIVHSAAVALARTDILPPLVAAWSANALFATLGLYLYLRART